MTHDPEDALTINLNALRSADRARTPEAGHSEFIEELNASAAGIRLTVRMSTSGHAVPEIVTDDGSYTLHSRYDPLKEAERALGNAPAVGTVCIFGLGFGYHVRRALKEPGFVRIIVVCEPLDIVKNALSHADFQSLFSDPRLHLVSSRSEAHIADAVPRIHVPYFSTRLSTVHLPTFVRVFPDEFERFRRGMERSFQTIGDDLTTQIRYARAWFRNILLNSISAHKTRPMTLPDNQPVTIVAAGPSLERHTEHISESRDFILVCDTAAPTLNQSGIKQAAVLSIDPSVYSYHHLMNGYPEGAQSILDAGVHPAVWRGAPGRTGVVSAHPLVHLMSPVFDHLPRVQFASDVAYAAVWIAKSRGMDPVTVIGADYRWTSGKPYARSTYIPELFLGTSSRVSTNEALTIDFMFATHPHLNRDVNGDYRVAAFDGRRSALQMLLQTPVRSLAQVPHRIRPPSAPNRLPDVLNRLGSLIRSLPKAGDNEPEHYFRSLDSDQQTAAFIIAPLAARLSRSLSNNEPDIGLMDRFDEAKANAIQLVEHVHSLSVSRIL
ncbi:MAG: 6-hydroxymethylpterin diphosphokinase MptE-like protein [Spirochaetota bacterium]